MLLFVLDWEAGGWATGCSGSVSFGLGTVTPLHVSPILLVCLGLSRACSSQDSGEGASWKVEILGASSALDSELAGHMTNPEAVVAILEPCLCLNIKCPPMLTFRMLSKLVVLLWETVGTLGGDAYSDKVGHWGCFWMLSWAFNPLFSLPPSCQEEKDIAHVSSTVMCPWTEPSKTVSPNNTFLLSCFP